LKPTTPQNAPGIRTQPLSLPIEPKQSPVDTAAEPAAEPFCHVQSRRDLEGQRTHGPCPHRAPGGRNPARVVGSAGSIHQCLPFCESL